TTAPAAPAVPTAAEEITPLSVAGGVEALARTLDGTAALPARFLASDLNFRFNSAEIEPSTVQVLDGVAGVLQSHPTAKLRVEGHTDATGNDQANMALSQSRAESVKDYLTGRGISADRLEAVGFGESKPLASNDTVEGRGQNRRTELVVTQR
ncbi:MAG TPA: OmpA family protein, partial [Polyangia bacterium]|nr:OmpA family protein [Polyangia bacterium]